MASLKTGEGGLSKVVLTTNAGGAGAATATLYRCPASPAAAVFYYSSRQY